MTEVDEQHFKTMDGCHICGEKYTDKDVHVRDHCHITGKFRGSAHQECNLKLRIKPEDIKIPVIFHNLRGYDSHFIMQQIGEIANKHGYTNKKGEKQDLYLVSDVLLLTDVFENFRKTCMQYYKLDPCHYFTSPGLSWDAMLKMTNIKLELMTDIDMFQFIEKGMRGGVSYIIN